MDHYELWFDLKDTSADLEFCGALDAYLGHLRDRGVIEGWRLTRRKLGFGPAALGEFHVVIYVNDLAQLETAFGHVSTRGPDVEPLHAAVFSSVRNVATALYRDFPDTGRLSS